MNIFNGFREGCLTPGIVNRHRDIWLLHFIPNNGFPRCGSQSRAGPKSIVRVFVVVVVVVSIRIFMSVYFCVSAHCMLSIGFTEKNYLKDKQTSRSPLTPGGARSGWPKVVSGQQCAIAACDQSCFYFYFFK